LGITGSRAYQSPGNPALHSGAVEIQPRRGRFLTLEGPEGAGKTVLGQRLATALVAAGQAVVLTREPGGTRLGERLRTILLEGGGRIDPRADALLFNAARAQLVSEIVRPALAAGQVVICARFADSTLAYQGFGEGLPLPELRALAEIATGGLAPDRTFLLDLDPEIGLRRKGRADQTRFEASFDLAFHQRVRAGFLELAAAEPGRFRTIDAARHVDAVFADLLAAATEAV
jgi:dTMP kinase